MSKPNPWFRAYTEMVDDEKLRLLAFEDRWHFVALLCCKGAGLLDADDDAVLLRRKIAVKLGLAARELDEVARRLAEVGLIDLDTLQPVAWDARQFKSDTSTDRVKAFRERTKQSGNVSETPPDTDTDTDTEAEKPQKQSRKRAPALPCPDVVDPQTWADWLTLRKAKRAPVTETVIRDARSESAKAGLPLTRFLEIWCSRGSQGLQADWLKPHERAGPKPNPSDPKRPSAAADFRGKNYGTTDIDSLPPDLRDAARAAIG